MNEFEKIVTMRPAFDRRHTDPKKNYGIHGVELRMVLRGPLGATQFLLFTNWQLPHVTDETDNRILTERPLRPVALRCAYHPNPADRGYHWTTPQYEGQTAQHCDLLPAGQCYYDGSGLNAEDTFKLLLTEGSDGVWKDLEDYYNDLAGRHSFAPAAV